MESFVPAGYIMRGRQFNRCGSAQAFYWLDMVSYNNSELTQQDGKGKKAVNLV